MNHPSACGSTRWIILTSLTAVIPCLCAASPPADASHLLPLDSFFAESPRFAERLSPDGKKVAFLGPDENATISLWLVDVEKPDLPRRISSTDGDAVRCFFWTCPDSLLWQCNAPEGRARLIFTNLKNDGQVREILPNETRTIRLEGIVPGEDPSVLISLSDTPTAFPDLHQVSLREGAPPILASRNHHQILTWAWDQAGTPVAGLRWTDTGAKELLSLRENPPRVIFHVEPTDDLRLITASSDGTKALVITDRDSNFTHAEWIELATGFREKLGADPQDRVDLDGLLTAGDDILATRYSDQAIRWHAEDSAFSATLQAIQESVGPDSLAIHGVDEFRTKILFKRFSARNPGDTWIHDSNKSVSTRLWRERPDLSPAALCESRAIEYPARDGTPIPAYLTIPKDASAPLPLVVFPHGGPRMRTHGVFDGRAQFLANRGYAVLQPNFRGSRGYGKAFMNAGDGEWGTGVMQTDVTDGVHHLIQEGIADAKRVAIFGGSYGGYAALSGLAFEPDTYAAGICLFGISDLLAYATHHPPEWEAYAGDTMRRLGNPDTEAGRKTLADLSPVNHATSFKAPLLIYHGMRDPLIPVDHALRMTRALQDRRKSVNLLLAPDESHGFSNPESEMAVYRAIELFLHQHLGGHLGPVPTEAVTSRLNAFHSNNSP